MTDTLKGWPSGSKRCSTPTSVQMDSNICFWFWHVFLLSVIITLFSHLLAPGSQDTRAPPFYAWDRIFFVGPSLWCKMQHRYENQVIFTNMSVETTQRTQELLVTTGDSNMGWLAIHSWLQILASLTQCLYWDFSLSIYTCALAVQICFHFVIPLMSIFSANKNSINVLMFPTQLTGWYNFVNYCCTVRTCENFKSEVNLTVLQVQISLS